ncbi:hypothetical protein SH139x_004109 [Planctomycetaceae bacterium SH139]
MRWTVFTGTLAITALVGLLDMQTTLGQGQTISSLAESSAEVDEAEVDEPAEIPVLWLTPATEPVPALQYRFWPDRFEMTPGNAFVRFQRAILLMAQQDRRSSKAAEEFWNQWEELMEFAPADLPQAEARAALENYQLALQEAHGARLLKDTDYGLPIEGIRGVETIELLLPEFQEMRALARILQLEIRLAIAEQRVDDALKTLQVGFRLGESTGQAIDFLVARLVGLAISGLMLSEVEDLIQADDCPNLYWALASLPPSTSEVLESIQFEASIISRVFSSLDKLPPAGLPAEVWEERAISLLLDLQIVQAYDGAPSESRMVNARLLAGAAIVGLSDYSRRKLLEAGVDSEVVEAMSPAEAMVRATARSIRVIQDDFMKWSYIPNNMRDAYWEAAENGLKTRQGEEQVIGDIATIMASLLLPAMQAADAAGTRTKQTIARLVTIEAIRDYVAKNGKVPQALDQLKDLPAWPDPYTDEAFGYERIDDQSAKLIRTERWSGDPETVVILKFYESSHQE